MEVNKIRELISGRLRRYGLPLLLIAVGAAVLLVPTKSESEPEVPTAVQQTVEESTETRLERLLGQVDGAGRVRVMLTVKNDGVTVYQTDTEQSQGASETETKTQTVFYKNGEEALIQSTSAPEYLGAVVVCDGAERAEVRLRLVRAVCALTGLTGNKISILKMKS